MPPALFLPLSLICAGLVVVRYHRIGRPAAGVGWALMFLSIGGFGSGLAESFAWSGLAFLFVGGLGLIVVLQDVAFRRQARRRRKRANALDLERET